MADAALPLDEVLIEGVPDSDGSESDEGVNAIANYVISIRRRYRISDAECTRIVELVTPTDVLLDSVFFTLRAEYPQFIWIPLMTGAYASGETGVESLPARMTLGYGIGALVIQRTLRHTVHTIFILKIPLGLSCPTCSILH
jgi:hypothetical protein